jgi:23S rRNA pseudouridine2605 synthase
MTQPPWNASSAGNEGNGGKQQRPQRIFRHRKKFSKAARQEQGIASYRAMPTRWKPRGDFQARRKRAFRKRRPFQRRPRVKKAPPEPHPMTLARALTRLKYASHAAALEIIREGRVQVNGVTVLEPNTHVLIHRDTIVADGIELIFPPVERYTVVFHKPRRVAASKELGVPTVYEYLPKRKGGYFPCGRLTKFASGIVIFSTEPVYRNPERNPLSLVEKEYHVKVHRHVKKRELEELTEELRRMSQYNAAARVELLRENSRNCWLRIVARQLPLGFLHRLLKNAGLEILHLHRYRLGFLTSEELPVGGWRRLRAEELARLEEEVLTAGETAVQQPSTWQQLYQRWFPR